MDRLLGAGGFGQVYLVKRLGRSSAVPEILCLKASANIDGWLREAYFGQLLEEHPRAIRVFDAFPIVQPAGEVLYCLAIEYARHGDLSAFLQRGEKGWREPAARREIAGILQVLGKLHRGQVLHRDLTPVNVWLDLAGVEVVAVVVSDQGDPHARCHWNSASHHGWSS